MSTEELAYVLAAAFGIACMILYMWIALCDYWKNRR